MNGPQKEMFHRAILRVLAANNSRFGLGVQSLALLVNEFGFSPKADEVEAAMQYLEDKEIAFVESVSKGQFHPNNRCWKITARGTNYLAEQNQ